VDTDGNAIAPTDAFLAFRDRLETDVDEVELRRPAMERVFADLEAVGVERSELTIAWDFTVISTESMTAPLLEMRDNAFNILGDAAPAFQVNSVEEDVDGGRVIIEGTYEVPLYLTGDGSAGNGLNLTGGIVPEVNGPWTAPFRCQITDATSAGDPGPGVIYMHGLLGTGRQTTSSGPTALARRNFVPCGTDLIGMAEDDVANAVASLLDASNFSTFADRLLQGHLNHLFLGRLMVHPDGFASHEAFQSDGEPLLDTTNLSLYGISQGGIMGAVSTAISHDWDRAVLGVPGINYSTLLNRSIDFDTYQAFLDPAYPHKGDQAIVLLAMQLLWDRAEGNGWAHYFAEPLPGMNTKTALLHVARGDQQVANVAADVMARTMGASIHWPAVADGRSTDVDPFWDIDRIESYPFEGSATVMWDSGAELSPTTNTPPRAGFDPHSDPRVEPAAVDQIEHFLRTGTIIDTCNGQPCTAAPDQ
jgi:hypothetical protein